MERSRHNAPAAHLPFHLPRRRLSSTAPTVTPRDSESDHRARDSPRGGWWKRAAVDILVGPTVQRLTRAARALVATAARRTACLHVSRAMQAARRHAGFDFPSRLGRRAEAGPRRVLPRVSPPRAFTNEREGGRRNKSDYLKHGSPPPQPT